MECGLATVPWSGKDLGFEDEDSLLEGFAVHAYIMPEKTPGSIEEAQGFDSRVT